MTLPHGHVVPNPNGVLARCGGPACCIECKREFARVYGRAWTPEDPENEEGSDADPDA